jgi:hypothetical protein
VDTGLIPLAGAKGAGVNFPHYNRT